MENGFVYILKGGHINNELRLSKNTEISHLCDSGNCKFLISNTKTYEYVECADVETASTWVNILLNIRRMVVEGVSGSRRSKNRQVV